MKLIKKLLLSLAALIIAALLLIIYIVWGNSAITVTEYTVSSAELPKSFDGFRILVISDLHCSEFGEENAELLSAASDAVPDIIVILGDLLDTRHGPTEIGTELAANAAKLAPTYFVTGNHEYSERNFDQIQKILTECGVTVLRNEHTPLTKDGESITLVGIDDPTFLRNEGDTQNSYISDLMAELIPLATEGAEGYTVLLSHRPEFPELFSENGADLVLSGHAHGGQFILPLIGGLYAPGQGWFPEYYRGVHIQDDTTVIISRGLGNSSFPYRFNNRPELVLVTLKCQ